MARGTSGIRHAEVTRESATTKIYVNLDFDGGSRQDIDTGISTLDWAVQRLADRGQMDLGIKCESTGKSSTHAIVEEVAACLGQAVRKALADHAIVRTASLHAPADDALVLVAVNLGGSAYLGYDIEFARAVVDDLPTEDIKEFMRVFAQHAAINLHVRKVAGSNDHHLVEAIFAGVGAALHAAAEPAETNSKPGSGRIR